MSCVSVPRGAWGVTVAQGWQGRQSFQVGIGLQVCVYVNYLSGETQWVDLGVVTHSMSVEVALDYIWPAGNHSRCLYWCV